MNKITQEVYENIGQVLSLIRVQLNLLSGAAAPGAVNTSEPSMLVGRVIKDLRAMCRNFHPETELLEKLGLIPSLQYDLKLMGTDKLVHSLNVSGTPVNLERGTELIVFRMLQEILTAIHHAYEEEPLKVGVHYEEDRILFLLHYKGKPVEWSQAAPDNNFWLPVARLNITERAELINAELQVMENEAGHTSLKLAVPLKTLIYEGNQNCAGG